MAVNSKKLKDIFGVTEDDTSQSQVQNDDIFVDEDDAENTDTSFTDIDIEAPEDDILPPAPVLKNPNAKPLTSEDTTSDFDFAVRVQTDLLNRQQQLIQIALNNAVEGNARDIEVATQAISDASAMAEKLITLHEKISKLKALENTEQQGNIITGNTINQVIYQGTTADIIKKIQDGAIDVN